VSVPPPACRQTGRAPLSFLQFIRLDHPGFPAPRRAAL